MSRSAILPALALVLILSGCDREADPAPQESAAQTEAGKEARPGEIDRSHAGDLMPVANMVDPDQLAADYEDELNVVTISQDMGDPAKITAFFEKNDIDSLPPWIDPQLALGEAIGAATLPTTVMYDRTGQEVWRVTGELDWSGEKARNAVQEVVDAL